MTLLENLCRINKVYTSGASMQHYVFYSLPGQGVNPEVMIRVALFLERFDDIIKRFANDSQLVPLRLKLHHPHMNSGLRASLR